MSPSAAVVGLDLGEKAGQHNASIRPMHPDSINRRARPHLKERGERRLRSHTDGSAPQIDDPDPDPEAKVREPVITNPTLSADEIQVLRLLEQGATRAEISKTLGIGRGVLTRRIVRIKDILGVRTTVAALAKAIRNGFV